MINPIFAIFALILAVGAVDTERGVILEAAREVNLSEPDVVIFSNFIAFKPGTGSWVNGRLIFEYVVAADYEQTLVELSAFDSATKYRIAVERAAGPLAYSERMQNFNSTDYLWFRVDLTEQDQGDPVLLEINEYHKRRRDAFPSKLSILDEQSMQFTDSRFLLSPYRVQTQHTLYEVAERDVIQYTTESTAKMTERGLRYGPFKSVGPLRFDLVRILFKYESPSLILTEASRSIQVSHWGNLAIAESFDMSNIGAEIKGEFSRVDFHKRTNAKNCLKQISAKYPWYINSLYFHDFIGNISSTNAARQEEHVHVEYYPRYPVCGGWKVDWDLGY